MFISEPIKLLCGYQFTHLWNQVQPKCAMAAENYERDRVISIAKVNRSAGCVDTEISNISSAESR